MLYTTSIQYTRNIIKHNDELKWTYEHPSLQEIYLSHFIRKGWCWLCVRGELEMGTDCYILTPSSSDHSSTSFSFWLGCSTVGHWGPQALSLQADSHASILSPTGTWTRIDWLKPSVAPGYIIVWHSPASCGCTHLSPSPNSTTSTGQGDIPISSTGCTYFAVLPFIYAGASLDWRLGRWSICYTIRPIFKGFSTVPGISSP